MHNIFTVYARQILRQWVLYDYVSKSQVHLSVIIDNVVLRGFESIRTLYFPTWKCGDTAIHVEDHLEPDIEVCSVRLQKVRAEREVSLRLTSIFSVTNCSYTVFYKH